MSSLADRTVDELQVSCRQWKAAITRHLGSLKRAVAEDDVTAVKERLDKMKLSFIELEAVHIELTGRLNTDGDITESDNWYAVVEDAYIVGVTDAHTWLRSSQATNVSPNPVPGIVPVVASSAQPSSSDIRDDLVNLLSIPKVVIDKFEGDPLEYQAFIATFDELVHSKTSDNQIKLTRLLQYTAGPAKQAIKYCALVGGADGYSQARTILKDRFGDKHTLSQKIISDLKQGKSVSKAHEFQQVADDLRTGLTVLEKQGMVAEIDTQQNILDILGRFPSFVKGKWRKHALDFKRDNSVYPNFASFVKFVAQFAADSCDPVYGTDIRKVQTARGKVHNNHSVTSSWQHVVLCRRRQPALACLAVWRRMAEHSRRRLVTVSVKHVLFVSSHIACFSVVISEVWPQEPDLTLQSCINCVSTVCAIIIEHVNVTGQVFVLYLVVAKSTRNFSIWMSLIILTVQLIPVSALFLCGIHM